MSRRTDHISGEQINVMLKRMALQIAEEHGGQDDLVIIGLQPRGGPLAQRIKSHLDEIIGSASYEFGILDSTFYRDDFRRTGKPLIPNPMILDFLVDKKKVVFVDDVLFTGRSVRAALNAINDFGRPAKIELLVLVDRRYRRELPIEPDYVGFQVDTRANDRVVVEWDDNDPMNNKVWIVQEDNDE